MLFAVVMLLSNCKSNSVEKPEKLIEKDVMVDIFYDLYVANAMYSTDAKYFADRAITPAKFVYQKYKIDSLQFVQNDHYYASDVANYEKIFSSVTQRLQKNKAIIDTIIAKSPEVETKKEVKKPVISPMQIRDSLKQLRLSKEKADQKKVEN